MNNPQFLHKTIILLAFALSTDFGIRHVFAQQQEHDSIETTVGRQGEHLNNLDGRVNAMEDDRRERRREALEFRTREEEKIEDISGRMHFDEGIGACAWALIGAGQIAIYRKEKAKKEEE